MSGRGIALVAAVILFGLAGRAEAQMGHAMPDAAPTNAAVGQTIAPTRTVTDHFEAQRRLDDQIPEPTVLVGRVGASLDGLAESREE